ncbi:MAG TPA: MarR family transcriptional regulator [Chloroflexota bacterium]|nr:MarR family transcriptional regulator [Chloroflexota bacterium]
MKGDASLDHDALRLTGTLLRAVRVVDRRFRRASNTEEFDLADLSVLGQIGRGVNMVSRIAEALQLDVARVSRICSHLEALGYVERRLDVEDRRRWLFQLSPAGERSLQSGLRILSSVVDDLLGQLTPADRTALTVGLGALRPILATPPEPSDVDDAAATVPPSPV